MMPLCALNKHIGPGLRAPPFKKIYKVRSCHPFSRQSALLPKPVGDSFRESSMLAGRHEKTHTPNLQDQELTGQVRTSWAKTLVSVPVYGYPSHQYLSADTTLGQNLRGCRAILADWCEQPFSAARRRRRSGSQPTSDGFGRLTGASTKRTRAPQRLCRLAMSASCAKLSHTKTAPSCSSIPN